MPSKSPLSEAQAKRLIKLYADAEAEILREINRLLLKNPESYSLAWQRTVLARVQQIRGDLLQGSRTWCQEAIPDSYMKGMSWADKDPLAGTQTIAGFGAVHQQAVEVLSDNALSRMEDVNNVVGRRVNDVFRTVSLEQAKGAVIGYETTRQTAKRIREDLANRGITGFTDKAGHEWDMKRYAKVLAQETVNQSFRQGTINRLQEKGHDLVRLSVHTGSCPKCIPWQGQTMSMSGQDPDYPPLEAAKSSGVFHVGCKHVLSLAPEAKERFLSSLESKKAEGAPQVVSRDELIKSITNDREAFNSPKYMGFKSEMRGKMDTPIKINYLSDEDLAILQKKMVDLDKRAEKLGLPKYRGIVDAKSDAKSLASMQDGVLAVTEDVFKHDAKAEVSRLITLDESRVLEAKKAAKLIEEYRDIERSRWEKNNARLVEQGVKWEDTGMGKEWYRGREGIALKNWNDEAEELTNRVSDLKTKGTAALKSGWKPGQDPKGRPWGVDEYFDFENRPSLVMDHEFGHHVHQQLDVSKSNWKNPPVEKDIEKMHAAAKKSKTAIFPSKYSDSEPQEWFAESYTLHVNGRDDLVDPRLRKYFKEKSL